MEWFTSMSVTEQIFFWISVVASILLVVQIVMLLVSFGGAGDGDFGSDFDGDIDSDSGLAFFSLKGLTAFFALGGWCGFATASYVDNVWAPILVSLLTGAAALVGVGFAMRGIAKLQCSGNLVKENLTGMTATVYVSIPAVRAGRGKITLTAQGKFMELDAVTDEEEKLMTDEVVVIRDYSDDFAVVERKKD